MKRLFGGGMRLFASAMSKYKLTVPDQKWQSFQQVCATLCMRPTYFHVRYVFEVVVEAVGSVHCRVSFGHCWFMVDF